MDTNDEHSGTYSSDFRDGLVGWIDYRCPNQTPTGTRIYDSDTVSEFDSHIRGEIVNGRPVGISLQDDDYYGNHWLWVLGIIDINMAVRILAII